ncbi:MAG: putative toxin-antitoxin system toxin component, PIN family [Pirellulaceae bacterium]|nr:putative toxin-antitoxin system toxin component, PIN family [Pirellulaceae bacterium]
MRAVLDTNVLISGLLWRGNAYQCIQAAEAGLYQLVAADEIFTELFEKLVEKFGNTQEEAQVSIEGLRKISILVSLVSQSGWVRDDPDDDKFVHLANFSIGFRAFVGRFMSTTNVDR